MVSNWKLSWDRISPALKRKTKHVDKTFKKKKKTVYQKVNKNLKPTIKNSQSICETHLKTHKFENIFYRHQVKKRHQTVNFCYKKVHPCEKKSLNCKFLL